MKAKIRVFILLVFLISGNLNAQEKFEELQKNLYAHIETVGYDIVAFKMAEELFLATIDISPSTASEYGAICNQIATNLGDSILIARSQNLRGISFMKQKTYFMATQSFFEAYEIYIKYDNKNEIAFTLLNIGSSYIEQDLEDIGESKIHDALKIYRQIGDSTGVADAYTLLGRANLDIDNKLACSYFEYAEKLYDSLKLQTSLASAFNLHSKAFMNLSNNELAINYLMKSLTIFKEQKIELKQAETYLIIGEVFYTDKLFDNALTYFYLARDIFDAKLSTEHVAEASLKIALTYLKKNDYNNAIMIANKTVELAEMHNNFQIKSSAYKIISDSYLALNNKENALKYSLLYQEALIEYYEQKSSRNFSAFQMNLEIQSKQQEIKYLLIENEKEKLQFIQKQAKRNYVFFSIIGFLVLLYLIFLIFRNRERTKAESNLQRSNLLLKAEIDERRKAELDAQSKEERYKLLFRKTPIGILQFNDDLLITDANERFSEIFNIPTKEAINKHINRIFNRQIVQDITKLFNSSDEILKATTEIPTKKEVIYVSLTVKKYIIWTNEGQISGGIIILEDFTEHKKAERYYKANILSKQKLIKQLPDDLILLDNEYNVLEIHFPDAPEREIGVARLEDVFTERHSGVFKSHLLNAINSQKNTQFFYSDGSENFLVRIIPTKEVNLIIISRFEAEAQDAGIIIKSAEDTPKTTKERYLKNLQEDIENELLPIYQNIQRGLSFIMIKNFAEKIVDIGKKYNNNKIKEYGDDLFDSVTSFNVVKVNKHLEAFPSLISQFMGIGTKFIQN